MKQEMININANLLAEPTFSSFDKEREAVAYSVAAEPPVRCGGSHWSGLSEPPLYRVYSYCA